MVAQTPFTTGTTSPVRALGNGNRCDKIVQTLFTTDTTSLVRALRKKCVQWCNLYITYCSEFASVVQMLVFQTKEIPYESSRKENQSLQ